MNRSTEALSAGRQFAERLAALRAASRLSLERLAERSGLTKSYLSKLERGLSQPSISSVSRLADAFGIGVAELLGHSVSEEGFRVLRRDQASATAGPPFEFLHGESRPEGSRISVYVQHPRLLGEAEDAALPQASHAGEEFVYVLSGAVRLEVADQRTELLAGDGAWYRAELVHRMVSLERQRAEVLVVTCGCVDRPKG